MTEQKPYTREEWKRGSFEPPRVYATIDHLFARVEELGDWNDERGRVLNEDCPPDESHCTCVPHLRAEVERLREALRKLDAELLEPDGTSHHAGEGLVERWAEIVRAALEQTDD